MSKKRIALPPLIVLIPSGVAQSVVEKKLKRESNLTKFDLGREKFIERVWEWKHQYVTLPTTTSPTTVTASSPFTITPPSASVVLLVHFASVAFD